MIALLAAAIAAPPVALTDPTVSGPSPAAETVDAATKARIGALLAGREGFAEWEVASVVRGAFTEAGAKERVGIVTGELVSMAEGVAKIAVFVDGAGRVSLRELPSDGGMSASIRAVDVDGDGRHELWYESGGTQMGETWSVGAVVKVTPDGLVRGPDVRTWWDSCATGNEDAAVYAARVVAIPDLYGALDVRWYKGSCGETLGLKPVVP